MIYLLFFVGLETVLITKLQKFRISALLCFCSFRGICMNFFLLVNSEIQMEGVRIGDNIIHYFTDFLFFASDP